MTPVRARLARARRALVFALSARGLLLALAVALVLLTVGLLADGLVSLPLGVRRLLAPVAILIGAIVLLGFGAVRARAAFRASDEQVALWFETRLPELRYALVTSADERYARQEGALAQTVASAPLEREVARASQRALARPAVLVLLLAVLFLLAPAGAVARVSAPRAGDALARAGAVARAAADPLASIVVRVVPPAYTGLPATSHDDPSTVSALAGSRVTVDGLGTGVRAVIGPDTVTATVRDGDRGGWGLVLPVPERAMAVRLLGAARERLLVIDPRPDSVPTAQLMQPTRDSVLRVARGEVLLVAELRDDLGLADGAFEIIVSAGAGEAFTFRSGRVAARRFEPGVRTARLEGALRLDTLTLVPGDLIHLRAVAQDRNDVTGPGVGVSETRTLRIARADEYDSVAVDPLPPTEPEKNALSQRMILQMTQELHARERRIAPAELQRESRRIGLEQTKLRKRVGEVVFIRLGEGEGGEHSHFAGDGHEHGDEGPLDAEGILAAAERAANADPMRLLEGHGDETPIVAINRPLLEAYNHMWRASTELETGKPGAAIPWMERAIAALQRARAAERIYLRGRPPRVVVDLAKVRGTGKEGGVPDARVPRAPLDADRLARLGRFDHALDLLTTDARAAADSLLIIRVTLPESDRATARALDVAATAVRRGGDVTAALLLARRALAVTPVVTGALRPWGG